MSYTFPSVTINNMTFTARRWGQFPTITYTAGATAGAEVVTLASNLSNITIQIADGASTNAQIKTAIANARGLAVDSLYASDLVSVAITSGHESDTNTTHTAQTMSGASSVPPPSRFAGAGIALLTVDPVNPTEGQVWYNLTSHLLKFYDGTTVQTVAHV